MASSFELIDLDTGNLVGSYLMLNDALSIVRHSLAEYGQARVQDLAVLAVLEDSTQKLVAADQDLALLAFADETATQSA